MNKISQGTINQRFIAFVDLLLEKGVIKNDAEFARSIGVNPGQLSDIRNGNGKNATGPMLVSTLLVYKAIDWLVNDLNILNEIIKQNGNPDTQRKVRELEAYKNFAEKALAAKDAELEYYKQRFGNGDVSGAN
jgi:hypothetical protein